MDLLNIEHLTQALNTLTEWLLISSLKSVPLIAAILLLQHGLKKKISANARYSLWLSLLICLSIPFGWNISLEQYRHTLSSHNDVAVTRAQQDTPVVEHISTPAIPIAPITTAESTIATPNTFSAHTLLSLLWLGIFLSLSSITMLQLQRFNRIRKTATPSTTQQERLLESSKSSLGINRKVPLLYSDKVYSPLTFGLFKPVIILPANIEQQLTPVQIQHVLLHELAHIQRHDIFWNWLAYWIALLHWFNPLIWYANKRMKADMEMACDAKVLTHISQQDRNDYGLTLINVSQLSSNPPRLNCSLGILENHRELKNRLIMIKGFTTMTLQKSFLFGLVFSVFAFTALAQPNIQHTATGDKASLQPTTTMTLAEFARYAEKDLKTQILVGQQYANLSIPVNISDQPLDYGKLLSQLKINEFTAYKSSDYIQIVPARDARWLAIPTVQKGTAYFDDEYVTDSIKLEKTCAGSVLATLRPLVPQYGHLTAMESANTLIISDFYSNVIRVKAMVNMLEENTPTKGNCHQKNSAPAQELAPSKK